MKKLEFSKIVTAIVIFILTLYSLWSGFMYYLLCHEAILNDTSMPDDNLAVVCVSTLLGALLSYCLYQFGLKNSRNKYGIDSNGEPFKVKNDITDEEDTYQ